jgi:predicted  nucleic acid-binding Zn-ribbon protein
MVTNPRKFLLLGVICLAFLSGAALTRYGKAAETQQITDGAASQVLVQEIRSLRRALQDFTVGNSRLQVFIERCRLQQIIVERLNDEYNGIQSQIDSNEDQIRQMEETTKNLERLLSAEADQLRRGEMEREHKSITTNIEQVKQRTQRLQERGIQANGLLQSERAKLDELKDSLDSLERSLTNQQAERK